MTRNTDSLPCLEQLINNVLNSVLRKVTKSSSFIKTKLSAFNVKRNWSGKGQIVDKA